MKRGYVTTSNQSPGIRCEIMRGVKKYQPTRSSHEVSTMEEWWFHLVVCEHIHGWQMRIDASLWEKVDISILYFSHGHNINTAPITIILSNLPSRQLPVDHLHHAPFYSCRADFVPQYHHEERCIPTDRKCKCRIVLRFRSQSNAIRRCSPWTFFTGVRKCSIPQHSLPTTSSNVLIVPIQKYGGITTRWPRPSFWYYWTWCLQC